MEETNAKLAALVDQMPDPDGRGMMTENIDKDKIEKAVAAIYAGGAEFVQGLIDMLGEPGSPENAKPHYALHCVVNLALIKGDEDGRRRICETLAGNLKGDRLSAYNKAYLCQELQWAGRREVVGALGGLLLDEELVEPAAMALTAIRDGAADQFRAALPKAQGKCRLNIIQSLGAVEDRQSVAALRDALGDADRDVRLAAGWGLSRMGDAGAIDLLIQAADRSQGWERTQATKHCLVLAEKLKAAGNREGANKIYRHLQQTRTDPSERYIQLAAAAGMLEK